MTAIKTLVLRTADKYAFRRIILFCALVYGASEGIAWVYLNAIRSWNEITAPLRTGTAEYQTLPEEKMDSFYTTLRELHQAKPQSTKNEYKKIDKDCDEFADSIYLVLVTEIKRREGYEGKAYVCPAGYCTIGYGTVIDSKEEMQYKKNGMPWVTANQILRNDIEADYNWAAKEFPKLGRPQHMAIVSLAHNVGRGKILKSGLGRDLKAGDKSPQRWLKWCRYFDPKRSKWITASNLQKTRKFEYALFTEDWCYVREWTTKIRPEVFKKIARDKAESVALFGAASIVQP